MKQPIILFEDEALLVVDKPAGMLSIPDRFDKVPSVLTWARKRWPDAAVAHRIDRDTSGVLCLVKDNKHLPAMAKQWEARTVEKVYRALVEGVIPDTGTIDAPLVESLSRRGTMIVHKKGKKAVSHYKVLQRWGRYADVEVRIETGRMHQIRVHLAHIGAPLLVDSIYGKKDGFYLSSIKRKYKGRADERPLVARQTLHAAALTLDHPVSSNRLTIEAPLPKDLRAAIRQLDKVIG